MTTQFSFMVGAVGWEHPQWNDTFYPEDLPEEWRLTYYSNEFPVVLVPLSRLCAAGATEFDSWCHETHEGFRYIVELDLAPDAAATRRLVTLAPKLLALVVPRHGLELPAELQQVPVVLEKVAARTCETHLREGMGHCWDGHGAPCWGNDIALVCLHGDDYKDTRKLKAVIASCQPALEDGRTLVVLFEGNPPSLVEMRNTRTICELLGY